MNAMEPGKAPAEKAGVVRDRIAGAVVVAIGLWAIVEGYRYGFGTMRIVGSGVVPVIVGACLILCGILIALPRSSAGAEAPADPLDLEEDTKPDPRLIFCIIGAMMLFALLAERAGFVIAAPMSAALACSGNRQTSLRETLIFSVGLTLGAVLLFHYMLGLQLPLLGSWFGEY